ncbi:MAG: PAQR family membrane homeostasis protein TrhA [Cyclobacteriaceae bacterium]
MNGIPEMNKESKAEELANVITHGIGVILSLVGLILLLKAAWHQESTAVIAAFVFGISLLMLYMASTLYHLLSNSRHSKKIRIFDHVAIYFLIAGTYTPFTLLVLPAGWGWTLFAIVWVLALAGVIFKIFFTGRFRLVSTFLYLGMGWLGIMAIEPMLASLPAAGLWWLLAGGLSYTAGVVFYLWQRLPFHHAVWHIFVLGGSVSHFVAIYFYVY